jgi:hypothetical protein
MADVKISGLPASTTPLAGTEVLPIVQSGATVKVAVSNLTAGRAVEMTQANIVSTTGTAETLVSMQTAFNSPSGNKSMMWKDGSGSALGRISVSYTAPTTSMRFGSLYNGGYQTSDLLVLDADGNLTATGNLVIGTSGKGIDFSATSGTGTSELLADYEEGTWTPTQGGGLTVVGSFSSEGTYTIVGRTVVLRGKVTGSTSIAVAANTVLCGGLPVNSNVNYSVGSVTNANLSQAGAVIATGATIYSTAIAATTDIYFTVTYYV